MRAVLIGKNGELRWTEVEKPRVGKDQVLLEIHAAGVNRADLLQRAGQYPPPAGWPEWMGLEAAGIVAEVDEDVAREGEWHVGDAACALLGGGGYAEYARSGFFQLVAVTFINVIVGLVVVRPELRKDLVPRYAHAHRNAQLANHALAYLARDEQRVTAM